LDAKIEELVYNLKRISRGYPTNQNLFSYGADYSFTDFALSYSLIDSIVIYTKCNGLTGRFYDKVEFRVSTLSEYYDAVQKTLSENVIKESSDLNDTSSSNTQRASSSSSNSGSTSKPQEKSKLPKYEPNGLTLVESDFQPHVENTTLAGGHWEGTWCGIFVSKPYLKKVIKSYGDAVRGLANINGLLSLKVSNKSYSADKFDTEDESAALLGAMLHHDTITGVSRNRISEYDERLVIQDYGRLTSSYTNLVETYIKKTNETVNLSGLELIHPKAENMIISASGLHLFLSQLATPKRLIRFFRNAVSVNVTDPTDNNRQLAVFSKCVKQTICEHIFVDECKQGQPKLYNIQDINNSTTKKYNLPYDKTYTLNIGDKIAATLSVDSSNGIVTVKAVGLNDLANDPTLPIDISIGMFEYIPGVKDDGQVYQNYANMQKNGKYVFAADNNGSFIPQDPNSAKVMISEAKDVITMTQTYYQGKIVMEITIMANAPQTQRISSRFYFDVLSFPTNRKGTRSNNYVVRYFTGLQLPSKTFITDSNGLEEISRLLPPPHLPIDRFYYPITKFVYAEGNRIDSPTVKERLSILVDRAEGCSMPKEGVIEVMLNRASAEDDDRGINEAELENRQTNVLHYIVRENVSNHDARLYRQLQLIEDSQPLVFSLGSSKKPSDFIINSAAIPFGLNIEQNPHLKTTFTKFSNSNNTMVRITNLHPAAAITLDPISFLRENFRIDVYSLEERSIDFTLTKEALNSLPNRFFYEKSFTVYKGSDNKQSGDGFSGGSDEKIILRPLEMRTFRIIGPEVN